MTCSQCLEYRFPCSIPVQNISAKLTPNPVEPPVNATVRDAKAVMDLLPSIRYNIETGMDNVSSKLDHIRSMVASLPFALHLVNDGLVMLVPSRRTIENPLTDEISFDIKTNVSEGLVMYIGDLQNQTTGHSDSLVSVGNVSVAIFLACVLVKTTLHRCTKITPQRHP